MTGTAWNPNLGANFGRLGLEWPINVTNVDTLDPGGTHNIWMNSSQTETIPNIALLAIAQAGGKSDPGSAQVGLDIYDFASAGFVSPQADVLQAFAVPGENASIDSGISQCTAVTTTPSCVGFTSTAYTFVDDHLTSTSIGADTDGLRWVAAGTTPRAAMFRNATTPQIWNDYTTNAAVANLTGRRIIEVRVEATVLTKGMTGSTSASIAGRIDMDTTYFPVNQAVTLNTSNSARQRVSFSFPVNPQTGRQWCLADLTAFQAAGGTNSYGVQITYPSGAGTVYVMAVNFIVRHITERRLVTGYGRIAMGGLAWVTIPTLSPTDHSALSFSKTAGHQYLLTMYSTGDGGVIQTERSDAAIARDENQPPYDLGANQNVPGYQRHTTHPAVYPNVPSFVSTDPTGQAGELMSVVFGATIYAFVLAGGTAISTDSQPYARGSDQPIASGTGVGTGTEARQYLTPPANISADGARLWMVRPTAPVTAADQLTVTLRLASTNALVAGPVTVDMTQFPIYRTSLHMPIDVSWPAVALTAGTSYYLQVTAVATPDAVGLRSWYASPNIVYLDPGGSKFASGSFGGTAMSAYYLGAQNPDWDWPWSLKYGPAILTGLGVTQPQVRNGVPWYASAVYPYIKYNFLTWNATGIGADFGSYEVQRNQDVANNYPEGSYTTIAIIQSNSNWFADFEMGRNIAVKYRVRQVTTLGIPSAWSATVTVTCATAGCELIMATNNQPPNNGLSTALAFDYETPEEWTLPEVNERTITNLFFRDRPVASRAIERRGDRFTKKIWVVANRTAAKGRIVFDTVISLLHDPTQPYIAVCDPDGRVWLTSPAIQNMARTEKGGQYTMSVQFDEVASTPTPVVTTTPWFDVIGP